MDGPHKWGIPFSRKEGLTARKSPKAQFQFELFRMALYRQLYRMEPMAAFPNESLLSMVWKHRLNECGFSAKHHSPITFVPRHLTRQTSPLCSPCVSRGRYRIERGRTRTADGIVRRSLCRICLPLLWIRETPSRYRNHGQSDSSPYQCLLRKGR